MAAKILIVDDHPIVREGLAMQIATEPDLALCGEAEDLADALKVLELNRPDVAIIDISLKNSSGIDLIRRIKDRYDGVRILVWSMYPENLYAERALRAGAQGYLNKAQPTSQVLEAIRSVMAGKVFISGNLTEELLRSVIGERSIEHSPMDRLSDRELEAFELFGHGLTTESIATRMHVSPKTVETYRARIKEKLGLKSIPELIQRAVQWLLDRDTSKRESHN